MMPQDFTPPKLVLITVRWEALAPSDIWVEIRGVCNPANHKEIESVKRCT